VEFVFVEYGDVELDGFVVFVVGVVVYDYE